MKIILRRTICRIGDEASGETKSGKKAKKNMESLGLRMLIKNPLVIIWRNPVFEEGASKFNEPVSRHMVHAKYSR